MLKHTISLHWRALSIVVSLALFPIGCNKSATRPSPQSSGQAPDASPPTTQPSSTDQAAASSTPPSSNAPPASPAGPSKGLHLSINQGDEVAKVIAQLGEPEQRGPWAEGETFLYFEKGIQVNFKDGKVLYYSLYDDGYVLKPGAPPFKKYQGMVEGISCGDTVERIAEVWGQPTSSYAHGQPGKGQMIVLDYKDRASLTVWPPGATISKDAKTLTLPSSKDINAQRILSITPYLTQAEK